MPTIFYLILRLLALLPLRLAHGLGSLAGWVAYLSPHTYQFSATKNIQICLPELSERRARRLKRRSYMESGKAIFELGAVWFWPIDRVQPLVREISGQALLDKAIEQGNGVILALPHLGCWEIIGMHCSARYPMTSLYRPPRIKAVDRIMRDARQRFGATLVPTDNSGIRKIYAALKQNHVVAILPDQDPRDEGSVFAPFFGYDANTATLLPRLAQKTGAHVLFAFAQRLPRGRGYHLQYYAAPGEIYNPDLLQAASAVNSGVEECVRRVPEQYQWTYKRFKTRPPGEAKIY